MFWLFGGIGLFALSLLAQVLIWQVVRVKREIEFLLLLFIVVPLLLSGAAYFLAHLLLEDVLLAIAMALALSSAYIQTYPALREDIPTFRVLLFLRENSTATAAEILGYFQNQDLFQRKVDDLQNDGLVQTNAAGEMELTTSGRALARLFVLYRGKLLGLGSGDG